MHEKILETARKLNWSPKQAANEDTLIFNKAQTEARNQVVSRGCILPHPSPFTCWVCFDGYLMEVSHICQTDSKQRQNCTQLWIGSGFLTLVVQGQMTLDTMKDCSWRKYPPKILIKVLDNMYRISRCKQLLSNQAQSFNIKGPRNINDLGASFESISSKIAMLRL